MELAAARGEGSLRDMTNDDWPEVARIYVQGIATGDATFTTEPPTWAEWDAAHLSGPRLVATDGARILGWSALSPVSRRAVYAGVAEVSVYVADDARGRGVGHALLSTLVARSEQAGLWMLQSSIFPENRASLALHARCGFRVVGTRERIAKLHDVWRSTTLLERRSPAF